MFVFQCGEKMLLISDVQYYVPMKLYTPVESIHLFTITGTHKPGNVKLRWNYIWDNRNRLEGGQHDFYWW